jgi:hypothetical protein
MASDVGGRGFPKIPAKNWWELRRRFQRAMPNQVTPSYLQTVLAVKEGHAKNLIPQLQTIGLIDEDGKPTPLANEWRTDEGYASACQKVVSSVYPQGLRDAVPPAEPNRPAAANWFMREKGVGEGTASQMASFYILVSEADPAAGKATPPAQPAKQARRSGQSQKETKSASQQRTVAEKRTTDGHAPAEDGGRGSGARESTPALHIDVQIHIPSDATPNQIDAIFASMAKHLYRQR